MRSLHNIFYCAIIIIIIDKIQLYLHTLALFIYLTFKKKIEYLPYAFLSQDQGAHIKLYNRINKEKKKRRK